MLVRLLPECSLHAPTFALLERTRAWRIFGNEGPEDAPNTLSDSRSPPENALPEKVSSLFVTSRLCWWSRAQ